MDINKENEFYEFAEESQVNPDDVTTDEVVADDDYEDDYNENTSVFENEEVSQPVSVAKKKKCIVQKPIIISIVAFLITAILVVSSVLIYDAFNKNEDKGIVGSWTFAEKPGEVFLVFDDKGNVSHRVGSAWQYGTYTVEEVEYPNEETGENDVYQIVSSKLYLLSSYGGEAIIVFSEDNNTMTLQFIYGSMVLERMDLPEVELNPHDVCHASADEIGATELDIDKAMLGSWRLELMGYENKFETYTFNEDGTGRYISDYVENEMYGYGYGFEFEFKYTVKDNKILLSQVMYSGETNDITFTYSLNKGKLLLDYGTGALAYEKVN